MHIVDSIELLSLLPGPRRGLLVDALISHVSKWNEVNLEVGEANSIHNFESENNIQEVSTQYILGNC